MTKYAVVKIIDDNSPDWSHFAIEYLLHAINSKAKTTVNCLERPAINDFSRFIGNQLLSEITQTRVEAFISQLRSRICQHTLRSKMLVLRLVFDYAIQRGYLMINPFRGIRLPPPVFAGRSLTDKEIIAFLTNMPDLPKRACILSLYTGMRAGEVLSLAWSEIKEDRLIVLAEKSKSREQRTILLHPKAREALGRRATGRVFMLCYTLLLSAVKAAWQSAGIGRVRFHDLRHTAATRFMEQSDDIYAMMDAFGWKNPASAKPYQHMTRTRQERILGIKYQF